MKKLNLFLAMVFLASASIMTSCKPSEELPTITVTVVGTPTYHAGETVQYKATVATPNKELKTFTVTGSGSIQPASASKVNYTSPADKWDATKDAFVSGVTTCEVYYDVVLGTDLKAGDVIDLNFTVGDDSNTASETAQITVATSGALKAEYSVTLGDQDGAEGSFLDLKANSSYTTSTASANAANIDVLFYKGASNGATLFAPAQAASEGISSFGSLGSWSTKTNTTFKVVTAADYDAATYSSVADLTTGSSLHKANNLTGGEYVAFKTDGGVAGVIKVSTVVAVKNALGTVSISVKVQDPASATK